MNVTRVIKLSRRFNVPMMTTLRLLRGARFIARAGSYLSDRALLADLLGDDDWCRTVPRDDGYHLVTPGSIPGLTAAVDRARRVYDDRRDDESRGRKAHLRDLLLGSPWQDYAPFVDFALSEPMLKIAAGYLRSLPELHAIRIFHTRANTSERSSQLFHSDQDDVRQLKFLIYLTDVEPDNGPFSFVPARHFETLLRATRTVGERLTDDRVLAVVPRAELIEVTGPAGSGVALDTNRSFHFGGRTRVGHRGVLVIAYTTRYGLNAEPNPVFRPDRYRGDRLRFAVMGG